MQVVRTRLQLNFGKAAPAYDQHAQLQHTVTQLVLETAIAHFPHTATLADIGCGTGYFAALAQDVRPHWCIMGVDLAPAMCALAQARCRVMLGDAAQLPFATASVDAAVSALCYQWVDDLPAAFTELARILKPGGQAILASLGGDTLHELRRSATAAQAPLALLPMQPFSAVEHALRTSGLHVIAAQQFPEIRYYTDVKSLLNSMRQIGAGNNFTARTGRKLTPTQWKALVAQYATLRTPEGIPATWEHHFFIVRKPQ